MQKVSELVNVNDLTRIAKGTSLKGDMISSTDIRVDGEIDGMIYTDGKVVVGETASLSGRMFCSNVDMWGKMDGDIYVKDILSVKSLAVINGNIHVRKLQVEMGAQINGTCKMISEQEFDKVASEISGKAARPAAHKESPKEK